MSGTMSVPAFITKLWNLVEDTATDEFISWDQSGNNFCVFDQLRFSKEILPLYFKHNNISSFIRQLNLYGFRKMMSIDQGALKTENDIMIFSHPCFRQDSEHLLDKIKRKITTPASSKAADNVAANSANSPQVSKLISTVNEMKVRQNSVESKLTNLKRENESLWREIAQLSQKHTKQQQIVNKLVQFLVSLVGNNREIHTGMKRKIPQQLMIANAPGTSTTSWHEPASKLLRVDDSISNGATNNLLLQDFSNLSSPADGNVVIQEVMSPPQNSTPTSIPSTTNMNVTSSGLPIITIKNQPTRVSTVPTRTTTQAPSPKRFITKVESKVDMPPRSNITPVTTLPTVPVITKPTPATVYTDHLSQNSDLDIKDYVHKLELNIDEVKDMLSGTPYNLDNSTLSGLFNPEAPLPTTPDHLLSQIQFPALSPSRNLQPVDFGADGYTPNKYALGNELIQYTPDIGPLFDDEDQTPQSTDAPSDRVSNLNTPDISDMGRLLGDEYSAQDKITTSGDLSGDLSSLNTPVLNLSDVDGFPFNVEQSPSNSSSLL